MLNIFRAGRSNVLIWALMALLVLGLAGFGIGVGGLGGGSIAQVGSRDIEAEAYARALDQELRAMSGQLGRALPMEEARQFGIDRAVLARLVNDAALDAEAERLGLSSGDAAVRDAVTSQTAFRGLAGEFDREAYRFALEGAGLTPPEFEAMLRDETTRGIIAASVQAPVAMPDTAALTILGFLGEARRFDWLRLGPEQLDAPVAAPTEAELAAYYEANTDRYLRPETQAITYASVTPEALAERIQIPEEALRAAYEAAGDRYDTPERRILDRIGFGTAEQAAEAKARIDAGETDFDAVAAERGLSAQEIDQGPVSAAELAPEARAAVFAAEGPGIVGPVATPLGPSLFRINAILAASTRPFEEARAELAREQALVEARARIRDEAPVIDDLIAGGATVEEIAAETELELGTLALAADTTGGLADDPAFRALAADARPGEETDPAALASGGIVVLRVDEVRPAAPIPLAEIRDRVVADWQADATGKLLLDQLEQEEARLRSAGIEGGAKLAEIARSFDVPVQSAGPLNRGDTLPGVPPELTARVFAATPDSAVAMPDGAGLILAQVTEVIPFDPETEENAALLAQLTPKLRDQAADDALALFTNAVRDAAGVSVNQPLIESTLARFP